MGLLVEQMAERGVDFRLARTEDPVDVENLLWMSEAEADVAVVQDVNEEVGMERVDGRARRGLGIGGVAALALQPEAEDDAGADGWVVGVRRNAGVEAEGGGFEGGAVGLQVFQQLEAEVVEGKFGEGDAVPEVFEVEDFVLEPEQLLVAVAQVIGDEVFDFLVLEHVVLQGGGEVHEGHPGFDAVLEVDVFVEVFGGPEIDELNGVVGAADPVDPAEALDDADGIPVDVVVDQVVAVLKVLAFADAVGGDEEVDFALLRHGGNLGAVLGAWGKVGEDLVVSARAKRGAGVAAAADEGQVDAEFLVRPVEQRFIEVGGGVRERGEDEDFPVRLAELVRGRLGDLGGDELLEFGQLGVGRGRDVPRGVVEDAELVLVALERLEPAVVAVEPEVVQAKLQFAAHLHGVLQLFVVAGVVEFQFQLRGFGILFGQGLEVFDLLFEALDLGDGALHRDLE
jgi:hypothetical protein